MLFHGRGADEHDLFPSARHPRPRVGASLGATARGPLSLPPGGAHWYAVRRVGYPDPETFHATYPQLAAWLDGLLAEHGIAPDRTVLGGFSRARSCPTRWGSAPGVLALPGSWR